MGVGYLPPVGGPGGFGGLSFTAQAPGEVHAGYSNAAAGSVRDAASAILGSSEATQGELQRAYTGMFMARALGSRNAFQQNEQRLGGEEFASGMSPELARLGRFSRESSLESTIAGNQAESDFGYHHDLAELIKGTGTEIAGLDMTQAGWLQQALLAKKARKANTEAGYIGLAGSALGSAASFAKPVPAPG